MRKQAINSSSLRIAVRKNYSLLLVVGFHFGDFEMLTANRTDVLLAFVYVFCMCDHQKAPGKGGHHLGLFDPLTHLLGSGRSGA